MPSVTLSAKSTTAWLPSLDESDTESDQDSLFDHELPTFNEAVATTFISPRLTIEASRDLNIIDMTVKLTQKTRDSKTTLVQWNINSVKHKLVQPSSSEHTAESFMVPQGKHHFELAGFLDSTIPESIEITKKQPLSKVRLLGQKKSANDGKNKPPALYVVYRMEISWRKKKQLNPLGKPVEHFHSIPFYFRRQPIEQLSMPIVLSSAWAQKADTTYLFSAKTISFDDTIRANISISPLVKSLRLTSVHFSIIENEGDPVRVYNVYCQHYMTPDLLEQHENELKEIEESGYEYKQHFLDTCCKGNLLDYGSDHTDLNYKFSLRKFTDHINPTTKTSHPAPTSHSLQSTLRFSLLETQGNIKRRRFFDHNISTPVTIFHRENALSNDTDPSLPLPVRSVASLPEKQPPLPAYES
ncbi:hypothetical protein B0I72DRAFT_130124 [Yarrowia lipolytica]|uniref:YALI0C00341p n=2 Tax=Yarrowia lipolytica TaxID=4952 RepID=Q6CDI1_YARLI|nr:YALI0C00341p [Yarrowia lipolytica CLIB122]AOW02139.1 hypothetical protein YALI1_C00368g [Yarrowia lipolytica]KAB8281002.1 hypothetical protein BKA91DRAFT_130303 [Yarrowia lipolytica]KAE8170287.1 hypothetical protein BKA90DRAFT_130775 [Yarrowia lipolytica]KAJ8052901.1 hypothetical protein LXG23DRAFT_49215 [Yarrowia lipolytica]QNP96353.1 Hypothetical protein YALI2_C00006g [Yarrowia lipolytica]|eukprot:XP_501281.1 YALI0C00341p [Yarrowia lipolytica CLIB122]